MSTATLPVYNFHVTNCHTYAVGACGAVVHNSSEAAGDVTVILDIPVNPTNPKCCNVQLTEGNDRFGWRHIQRKHICATRDPNEDSKANCFCIPKQDVLNILQKLLNSPAVGKAIMAGQGRIDNLQLGQQKYRIDIDIDSCSVATFFPVGSLKKGACKCGECKTSPNCP